MAPDPRPRTSPNHETLQTRSTQTKTLSWGALSYELLAYSLGQMSTQGRRWVRVYTGVSENEGCLILGSL